MNLESIWGWFSPATRRFLIILVLTTASGVFAAWVSVLSDRFHLWWSQHDTRRN